MWSSDIAMWSLRIFFRIYNSPSRCAIHKWLSLLLTLSSLNNNRWAASKNILQRYSEYQSPSPDVKIRRSVDHKVNRLGQYVRILARMPKFALVKSLPLCWMRKSAADRIKGIQTACWPNRQNGLHRTRPRRQHEADASRPYRKALRRRQHREWGRHPAFPVKIRMVIGVDAAAGA